MEAHLKKCIVTLKEMSEISVDAYNFDRKNRNRKDTLYRTKGDGKSSFFDRN